MVTTTTEHNYEKFMYELTSPDIDLDKLMSDYKISLISNNTFLTNVLKLADSIKENYIEDKDNKFEINYIENGNVINKLTITPKIIKPEIYNEKLDDLVDEHFKYITDALTFNSEITTPEESIVLTEKEYDYM